MDRRRALLIVAAVIAALGTLLVIVWVRSADSRAEEKYDAIQVLKVTKQIDAGETVAEAQAAGKIALGPITKDQLLDGSLDSLATIEGDIAQTTLYPGEQIVAAKFAPTVVSGSSLQIPKSNVAVSVNLTDTQRVAGFVNPGDRVAVIYTGEGASQVLLPDAEVIAVGTTTMVPTTTTDQTGAQTTEQLPRTLFTLGVSQRDAQKVLYATGGTGGGQTLAFALLNDDSVIRKGQVIDSANMFR